MFHDEGSVFSSYCGNGVHPLICVEQCWIKERSLWDEFGDIVAAVNGEVGGYVEVDEEADFFILEIKLRFGW